MIEIIQENSKTEDNLEGKLPKNIRQIGNPEKDFRIYMEDYVYTYLHPARLQEDEDEKLPRLLILLGDVEHFSNRSCAFISGAISVSNELYTVDNLELDEDVWQEVRTEIRQFFSKTEIIGWVLDLGGKSFEITENIEALHRKHFSGRFQFLFLMDSQEREEAFYMWKQGQLTKKEGYFIYYEKNPQMQEYMISQREALLGENPSEENVDDQAALNYRAMMLEKKDQVVKTRWSFGTYATYALMIISLCTVSAVLIGGIKKVEHMDNAISKLSVSMESTETQQEEPGNQVTVETISSSVVPIDQTAAADGEGDAADDPIAGSQDETVSDGTPADQTGEAPDEAADQQGGTASTGETDSQNNTASEPPVSETQQSAQSQEPLAPADASEHPPAAPEKTDAQIAKEQGYYIVQKGDSLRQICYKIYETFTMMEKLCEANSITDENNILAGQKLILP